MRGSVASILGIVLAIAAVSGCAREQVGDPTPRAGQADAVSLVWGFYGSKTAEPPRILWRDDSHCDGIYGWIDENGHCAAGEFFDFDYHVEVAVPSTTADGVISDSTLVHELCHAFNFVSTGDGDPTHVGPCFKGVHLVDQASAKVLGL